jgi:hypothetical protein
MVPGVIIGGMAVALYYEYEKRRAKKRHARCHRPITMWSEYRAEK